MKILQIGRGRDFAILEIPIPTPGPGEVLVKIEAVTTCPQWDLHLRHDEPMFVGHAFHHPYTPGQPGHEAVGFVAALGDGVGDLSVGERVCAWRDTGHGRPGCYAQYVVHRAENLISVPTDLPGDALAPVELAMCVGSSFRMLRAMDGVSGRVFGVVGLGPAGLIAAQMARAEDAKTVLGFDLSERRREWALGNGLVDDALDPTNAPDSLRLGAGIDCVGAKVSVQWLLDKTDDIAALFGVQREAYSFEPRHYSRRLCGYPGHNRESAEYAVGLIRAGKLDLSKLVTHHFPLENYAEAIDLLESQDAIKICFWPHGVPT